MFSKTPPHRHQHSDAALFFQVSTGFNFAVCGVLQQTTFTIHDSQFAHWVMMCKTEAEHGNRSQSCLKLGQSFCFHVSLQPCTYRAAGGGSLSRAQASQVSLKRVHFLHQTAEGSLCRLPDLLIRSLGLDYTHRDRTLFLPCLPASLEQHV